MNQVCSGLSIQDELREVEQNHEQKRAQRTIGRDETIVDIKSWEWWGLQWNRDAGACVNEWTASGVVLMKEKRR